MMSVMLAEESLSEEVYTDEGREGGQEERETGERGKRGRRG